MPEFRNHASLPKPQFPGSHVVIDDRYVYVSGLEAVDIPGGDALLGDVPAETRLIMDTLSEMLAAVECSLADVVRVDVHLADIADIGAMDAVYAGYFPDGRYPARTCTGASGLFGGCRVEITMMARRP
ncbi:2-iminobutanoate/2-iminopropanoate deaminase [Natronocella acetinitrilica]|uniref:2-iminobutanoate/2-iminopropanoate deaminase n=1 Tax=Natronocella acetinitrilica TaxID=414046 RepID=A0AAE3G5U4_9GAMM|nr:RidA family protein [Natronocella acetinitrilica]MCP1675266.1 2-iminobutanoate/2-iminopropanoate deaminase [Natronocella acetinitrilica]